MPSPIQNFAGLSFSDSVTGGRAGAGWPPDTNGAVGRNHYIEAVNEAFAIYDKTGVQLAAFTENSLWSGSGSTACNGNSFGDPIVVYDQFADRWILANLAFVNFSTPFYECIAVSQTNDPVGGGWFLYPLRMDPGGTGLPPVNTLNDYPKFGIWNDGCLYMSANGFANGGNGGFSGALYASLNLSDMETGRPVTWSLGFTANSSGPFSLLPSNVQGVSSAAMPPAGTPNYFVSQSPSSFAFEVRTFTPGPNCGAGGTLSAPVIVSESSYTDPTSIPQPNTSLRLDGLDDRLLQKLQYRKVGSAESLWLVHSVRTSTSTPVTLQWAQLDVTGGTIATTPVQQQIYSPDTTLNRWMGSIAADRRGNAALGYSTSNGTSPNFPSIAYSGRLATDPLNNLSQTETVLINGSGSQTNIFRWGDYTSMSVDPTDDCTFWYTNEYYSSQSNGGIGNWQTRIGSFKFSSCAPTTPELMVTKTHSTNFSRGQSGTFTVTVSNTPNAPITSGTVTVTDTLPSGLSLVSMAGTGWTCSSNSCTRNDGLAGGSSYPAITVTVNVASDASSPQVNSVTASGGGSPDATGTDTVLPLPRLFITKSHSGSFTQNQNGVYTVTVSNVQSGSTTSGTVTVTDALPSGLTIVSMAGTGWTCASNSCTRNDGLDGGSAYPPITVTVSVSQIALSPQVNSVSASGGGSLTATTTDSTVIIPIPPPNDEWANATIVGPLPYTQTENITAATTNSADPSPCFFSMGRTVWYKYVADFTGNLRVDTTGSNFDTHLVAYQGTVSAASFLACNDDSDGTLQSRLMLQVTSGQTYYFEAGTFSGGPGGVLNVHVLRPALLSITKAHSGTFTAGQTNATYKIVVSNDPSAFPTVGTVTVTDFTQFGLTLVSMAGTGWTCATNTCTRSDSLAPGSSFPAITVTVNIASNFFAAYNSATVSGGGSTSASAFDFSNIITTGWSITKTHSGSFVQGQTGATYSVVVSNFTSSAAGASTVTVTDTLPSGLTLVSMAGTGWTCTSNSCTRSDGILPSTSYPPIIVTVNVAIDATSPQLNSVSVSGGGLTSSTATDSTPILTAGLIITKTHSGDFAQGQVGATYIVTVSNPPGLPTSTGFVSVQEIMPSGLIFVSMTGTGWSCSFKFCSRSDALAGGSSYPPITVTVNVMGTATSPQVNAVTVSEFGAGSSTAFDSTNITIVAPTNDEIATAALIVSLPASFGENTTLATSNPNDPPQSCSLTPSKPTPKSLQNGHTVWFKYVADFSGLLRVDSAGSDYDTVLTAYLTSVSSNTEVACNDDVDGTLQSRMIFPVTSGQTYYFEAASYGGSSGGGLMLHVSKAIVLSISKTHTGDFTQGQNGTYTLTVSNAAGAATTDGSLVSVSDNLPFGLNWVSMTGTGWSCSFLTCSRSDNLAGGASYPPITLTVNVASYATSPEVNSASVTGGGSPTSTATDSTNILLPVLSISKTHVGNFTAGQLGATYTVTLSNTGAAPTNGSTVQVNESTPFYLPLVALAGTGWICNVFNNGFGTCTRSDALAAGSSYPPITVTVNVASNPTSPQVNQVSVVGGGSVGANASDSTIITGYIGFLDVAACNAITGWAADRLRLNQSITVDIYDGSALIASGVPANLSRPDVGAFLGDNGLHGFSIVTPASLRDGKTHSLTVKFGGSASVVNGSPKSLSCQPPQYTGSFDLANCNGIAGWAADRSLPNVSITVDIYDGATLVAGGVPANLSRPDVGAFLGDNGLHGFSIATPSSLKDGNPHSLSVRFGGTATALGGSPKSLSCAIPYTGFLDQADCNAIAGWAADRNRLNQSITVDIYDGATLIIPSLQANQSRPDVGAFLGDNGLHGFSIATPASLKDGNMHSLTVKFGGTATAVGGSPKSLSCPTTQYTGSFDLANCSNLAGWAADGSHLNQSINVDVYDGTTLLMANVPANQSRPDVGTYLGDNGLHGFSLATPAGLKTNSAHSVSFMFGGTTTPVPSSPKSLTCPP